MKKIVCHIEPFQLEQYPAILENGVVRQLGPCRLDGLSMYIVKACMDEDITQVAVFGNRHYGMRLADEIKELNMTLYGQKQIEVEVV